MVVYDISSDKIRNRVAEACKDYGLDRIQWSAFLGDLTHNRRGELTLRLRRTLGRADGSIHIYPICDKDFRLRTEIGTLDPLRLARKEKGEGDTGEDPVGSGRG